jgi:hypothetical protein
MSCCFVWEGAASPNQSHNDMYKDDRYISELDRYCKQYYISIDCRQRGHFYSDVLYSVFLIF